MVKRLHGQLYSATKDSSKLIIIVGGLLSDYGNHLYFNAKEKFTKRGFDVFLLNPYSSDTTIDGYVSDLQKVINKLRVKKEIYVIGHSLGGYISLCVDTSDVKKMVLWDPSLHPNEIFSTAKKSKPISSLAVDIPTKIIWAETGKKYVKKYYQNKKFRHDFIKGAGHNFREKGSAATLYKKSLEWFEKKLSPPL